MKLKVLTVEGGSNELFGLTLDSQEFDLVESRHVVEALSVDEHLQTTSHGNFR